MSVVKFESAALVERGISHERPQNGTILKQQGLAKVAPNFLVAFFDTSSDVGHIVLPHTHRKRAKDTRIKEV